MNVYVFEVKSQNEADNFYLLSQSESGALRRAATYLREHCQESLAACLAQDYDNHLIPGYRKVLQCLARDNIIDALDTFNQLDHYYSAEVFVEPVHD